MASKFISGIFNYCDAWCDRCAFTRRCRNFAMREEIRASGRAEARSDEDNASFWNSIDGVFASARKQLDSLEAGRFADEFAMDWDEPDEDEMRAFHQREEAASRAAHAHPLMVAAGKYRDGVAQWLESAKPDIAASVGDIIAQAKHEFEVTAGTARREFEALEEMMDVITWYHTLLQSKTYRFVRDILEDGPASGLDGEDTLGTAKLLLVSLDRSISAWMQIREYLPSQEDRILGFLVALDKLRRGIEKAAPAARAYLRPGLDG